MASRDLLVKVTADTTQAVKAMDELRVTMDEAAAAIQRLGPLLAALRVQLAVDKIERLTE